MSSPPRQIFRTQLHRAQLDQTLRPQPREFIQQLAERLPLALLRVSPAIERLKLPALAELQNHPRPRQPVRAFAVNQVAQHFARAPSLVSLVTRDPNLR